MRAVKRGARVAVLASAFAALAAPMFGLRPGNAHSATDALAGFHNPEPKISPGLDSALPTPSQENRTEERDDAAVVSKTRIPAETLKALGLPRISSAKAASERIARELRNRKIAGSRGRELTIQSGEPSVLDSRSPLSATVITAIGGRDNQFSEVALIADWDGREDCTADREQKLDDFSFVESEIDFTLLRAAISEHTVANGWTENVYYYGDSVGNFWIGTDLVPGVSTTPGGSVDTVVQVNIPELVNTGASGGITLLNPTAGDCSDDQVAVTGIAVNPVADLGDFAAALCGTTGEIVYVSVLDTEGCASNATGNPIRTRIFAFGFTDLNGTGVVQQGVRQILRNTLSNVAGVSVDDDGNLYFQLVDLLNASPTGIGGAIFKATEIPHTTAGCAVNPRINRSIRLVPNVALTSATPITDATNGVRLTNYSGTSPTFGNIVAIDNGSCNVLYAAVARSLVLTDVGFERLTEGPFTAPAAFGGGGLPSMIISFADCSGQSESCTSPAPGLFGIIAIADGFADVQPATPGTATIRIAGVNNFRLFVQGDGPDVTGRVAGNAVISSSLPSNTIAPVVGFQIDFSLHSGIAVNEEGTVFVISGGTPAGIGTNPSPMLSEILCFEDMCPMNRRADFVDLRGNGVPNPPNNGGNVGDGDSDRFDHIFYQPPLDQVTLTPAGLAGLARGFLRYTNRLAPAPLGTGVTLGATKRVQGDDDSDGTIIFENFDPGHQVAGGDDQNFPFRGDDNDGAGTPPLAGLYSGGFEFTFGGPVGTAGCTWNGFFLNSNGNITFGVGDPDDTPTVPELRTGPPRIAPAWADLNPNARVVNPINFPVQALGFASVNDFRIRWLNVPEFGSEGCSTNAFGLGGNTFSMNLFDDGTGAGLINSDENNSQPFNSGNPIGNNTVPFDWAEGPTDLRFITEPTTGTIIGCPPRPDGSGIFSFEYCRMELLGTAERPVVVGYSIGFLSGLIISGPAGSGLCEINLSPAAAAADTNPFGVIQGTTAVFCNCCIGEGTEPTLFELFNEGIGPRISPIGQVDFAVTDFDLRFEGNDSAMCTPSFQRDLNRGKICFLGVACGPPANPVCVNVTPVGTVAVAPGQPAVGSAAAGSQRDSNGNRIATPTSGIINAVCSVQLNILGCGFFPNEVTTVCQGFGEETGIPLQEPGKIVSTAVTLACDFNGDGINEAVIALASVTPINCNLVRATVAAPSGGGAGQLLNCSGFPAACCGGLARLTVTTTFTAGRNNAFGPFTRTTFCTIDLGIRAPVVFSVTPSSGPCGILEDVLITGACFCLADGSPNVTSVFAVEKTATNPVTVQATGFKIVNCSLIDAEFPFTSANAGKTFLVFVSGPNGTSRNISTAVAGNAGCPASSQGGLGNEQCIQVLFTCTADGPACPGGVPLPGCPCPTGVPAGTNGCVGTPVDVALVNGCNPIRDDSGAFALDVFGRNLKAGAQVTVGGVTPRRVKVREPDPSSPGGFLRITLKGRICNGLPGIIIVTNPAPAPGVPPQPSQPFVCTERCATN